MWKFWGGSDSAKTQIGEFMNRKWDDCSLLTLVLFFFFLGDISQHIIFPNSQAVTHSSPLITANVKLLRCGGPECEVACEDGAKRGHPSILSSKRSRWQKLNNPRSRHLTHTHKTKRADPTASLRPQRRLARIGDRSQRFMQISKVALNMLARLLFAWRKKQTTNSSTWLFVRNGNGFLQEYLVSTFISHVFKRQFIFFSHIIIAQKNALMAVECFLYIMRLESHVIGLIQCQSFSNPSFHDNVKKKIHLLGIEWIWGAGGTWRRPWHWKSFNKTGF